MRAGATTIRSRRDKPAPNESARSARGLQEARYGELTPQRNCVIEHAALLRQRRQRHDQVLLTLIVGIFSDMSFAFCAMRTATLRAMAR